MCIIRRARRREIGNDGLIAKHLSLGDPGLPNETHVWQVEEKKQKEEKMVLCTTYN